MLHPASAHFAIVLPIIASIIGLIYLVVRTETASKLYTRATLAAALALIAAWYTGSQAGPEIYNYLSVAGQETLKAHKALGLNLAIAISIIAIIAMVACKLKKYTIQLLTVIALLALSASVLYQGKMGGEIVYKYGTPFKSFIIIESLNEANTAAEDEDEDESKVEVYQDAIDDILSHSEEIDTYYGIVAPKTNEDEDE